MHAQVSEPLNVREERFNNFGKPDTELNCSCGYQTLGNVLCTPKMSFLLFFTILSFVISRKVKT